MFSLSFFGLSVCFSAAIHKKKTTDESTFMKLGAEKNLTIKDVTKTRTWRDLYWWHMTSRGMLTFIILFTIPVSLATSPLPYWCCFFSPAGCPPSVGPPRLWPPPVPPHALGPVLLLKGWEKEGMTERKTTTWGGICMYLCTTSRVCHFFIMARCTKVVEHFFKLWSIRQNSQRARLP